MNFKLNENLRTIGKEAFVLLFQYIDCNIDKEEVIRQCKEYCVKNNKKEWQRSTFDTKFSTSEAIFNRGEELIALEIITNSTRIPLVVRHQAAEILSKYYEDTTVISEHKISNNKIINDLCEYAYDKGVEQEDIIDAILSVINYNLEGDEKVELDFCDNDVCIKTIANNKPYFNEVPEVSTSKSENIDLNKFYKEEPKQNKFTVDDNEMFRRFKSRLTTQNRKYANGFIYYPTLFNKLPIDFKDILASQLSKIYTYIEINNNYVRINVNELSKIEYNKGKVFGEYNKQQKDLYFKINNNYYLFEGFVDAFKEISLGHTKSMFNIINEANADLIVLKSVSKMCSNYEISDIKQKYYSDKLSQKIKESNINMSELKSEIFKIEESVEMELMPKSINIAMGKN